MRTLAAITTLVFFPVLASCAPEPRAPRRAGGGVLIEQASFPTRDAVAKIAAVPAPAKLSDERGKDVPAWELTGPLPDVIDRVPVKDESAWGQLFAASAAARGDAVVATEAMRCVAREDAAFYLANGALPAETLQRFIAARCGSPGGYLGTAFQIITADPSIPDAKIVDQFRDKTRAMIDKTLQAGRVEAGLAYVRKGGKAVIALSVAPQTVRLEPTPLVPGPDGKIVIKGESLIPAVGLRALINRGRYSYAECAVSPAVRLPRFMITCQTSRDDEVAWLSVSALPPGRVLGEPLFEMMAWPSGTPQKAYARLSRPPGEAAAASTADLLKEINRVRGEAKLPPVRLSEPESVTAARLAPHYFNAVLGSANDAVADQVALGLLAGWDIAGTVRNGHFVSMWVSDATSSAEVVSGALARPIGRETLLDPTAEIVAIGPVAGERGQGAVFSTYALFDGYRHEEDAKAILARLAALRAARNMTPPKLFADLGAVADRAALSVQRGTRAPVEALDDLIQHVAGTLGRSARGWVVETTSLDRIVFPPELEANPSLALGIGVSHHRRPNEAWGRFVVLVVMLDDGGNAVQTASRGGSSG